MNPCPHWRVAAILILLLISAGCMVGPNYKRPSAPAAPAFKEQPPVNYKEAEAAGWKLSQPGDAFAKGRWWELYNDAALNALEEQVSVSNQNVLRAEAQYRQAKAAVSVARASNCGDGMISAAPVTTHNSDDITHPKQWYIGTGMTRRSTSVACKLRLIR